MADWTEHEITRVVALRSQHKGAMHIAAKIGRHVDDVIERLADAGVRARISAIRRERLAAPPKRVYRDQRNRTKVTAKDHGVSSSFVTALKEKCATGDAAMAKVGIRFEDDPRAVPSEGFQRFSIALSDRSYTGNAAALCMR